MTDHRGLLSLCFAVLLLFAVFPQKCFAVGQEHFVDTQYGQGDFALVGGKQAAPLCLDPNDYPGVIRAAHDLAQDISRVTGLSPVFGVPGVVTKPAAIIIGTLGKNALLDQLSRSGKIDVTALRGKWESYLIQTVRDPFPGVAMALVIAGSDKRGTIYGIYEISEQIGVSPWYWWADVPIPHQDALFVRAGRYFQGEPAVKYRGMFLNDEAPSLTGWTKEKFGGYNHEFYVKVFELLLRLRANYLWPAMWGSAFNEDDPLNPKLADEYGIVMGTSHHEPMLRAQQEWKRHGKGPWDYSTNGEELREFWTEGIERNKNYESIVTLGMRGDGDMPMSEQANVDLLEKIVADQRKILADKMNPDVTQIPQDWALYKEVQQYYEKGMRVPEDVTLLWCDDNWGNIRRLPTPEERKRSGGAGIYYHFDYVGDPRDYKWINTNPIPKVWEQMNLAYYYGATRIWIVNVGDLKPMEFPIEFFLTFARNPEAWPKERLGEFTRLWAEREFGPKYASQIADLIAKYGKYTGRRKPELLEPTTFSLVNYQEADRISDEYQTAVNQAQKIYNELPENYRDAFFQLVLFPLKAPAIVTQMYIAAGKNRMFAEQGRARANDYAVRVRELFDGDADLAAYYNHTLAGGKWDHMMDQTHIGYISWNDPPKNVMPNVTDLNIPIPAKMGVAVEGSTAAWPGATEEPRLPEFDSLVRPRRYLDIFNRGRTPFRFSAKASAPWIELSRSSGEVDKDERVWLSVDWRKAPAGKSSGTVTISSSTGETVSVTVPVFNPGEPTRDSLRGFVQTDEYVSIEADHFTRRVNTPTARWEEIPDYGRTDSAMSVFPVDAASYADPRHGPCLEYRMYLFDPRKVGVEAIFGPSLNFVPGRGLRYAIAFDDQAPQIVDMLAQNSAQDWSKSVKDNIRISTSSHSVGGTGYHMLKIWMVDPGIVLEKLVVKLGPVRPSYLGPPESFRGPLPASGEGDLNKGVQ
ncbi:MAG TPA: glycosyl hydrolase 115 family protein [Verrucomicrobiae bacterium]|nr:glycosyl hydrolase 115 family protein [Verrucomicrobiae bacterium]